MFTSKNLLTVVEVQKILRCGRTGAYVFARQHGVRLGKGRLLVPRSAVDKWAAGARKAAIDRAALKAAEADVVGRLAAAMKVPAVTLQGLLRSNGCAR